MSYFHEQNEDTEIKKKKQALTISMPIELLVAIDRKRGEIITRSAWIVNELYKLYDADIKRIRRE